MHQAEIGMQLTRIADARDGESSYESATLACLREAFGFDVGFFIRRGGVGRGAFGLEAPLVRATAGRFPVFARELEPVFHEAGKKGLAVDRDVLGATLWRSTRVYREFVAPHAGHSTLLIPLSRARPFSGVLALGRRRRGFAASEVRWLSTLVPVLRVCEASRARPAHPTTLTMREREVLDLLCLGYANAEIAMACGSSVNTVRNQLHSVYQKLGASTRAEAVGLALRGP